MSDVDLELAYLRRTRAEKLARAVRPVGVAAWGAAEVIHLTGAAPGLTEMALGTAALTGLSWGLAATREKVPDSLPWWAAIGGAWFAAAAELGPLDWWPAPLLTVAWGIYALAASWAAHRHEAVTAAREWRAARAGWLAKRHRWGLGGSHLLDYREDEFSEWYLVSTKGTGKRASQLAGRGTAELISEAEDLPPARVLVKPGHLGGRLEITVIRAASPWAEPELHPFAIGGEPGTLAAPWQAADGPAQIGKSLEIPIWGKAGAKTVNIVSIRGWGKTVVLNCLSERITAAPDVIQVRINLSDKGYAEAERWGPACHLTAFGPQQQARAVQVLRVVSKIMEWRSRRYTTTFYVPSPRDPLIVVIIDESDSAMKYQAVRDLVDDIATKGREPGVALVKAGQRGTVDYSSKKQKSQDEVSVTGAVRSQGEVRHAAGSAAWSVPDMAAFSEGNPGVWTVTELGGAQQRDQAWLLERADAARLAAERAMTQPELHPDCVAFLGEPYRELLGTEVFTRWAHGQDGDGGPDSPGFVPVDAPALAQAARDAREPAAGAPEPETPANTAEAEDPLRRWETEMDDTERGRLDSLAAKLGGTRRMLEQAAAMPESQMSPEDREAAAAEAWRKVAEAAQVPADALAGLMGMLEEGATASAVAKRFGVSKWTARKWLENLRDKGAAYVDGERATARWLLAPPLREDDAQ